MEGLESQLLQEKIAIAVIITMIIATVVACCSRSTAQAENFAPSPTSVTTEVSFTFADPCGLDSVECAGEE